MVEVESATRAEDIFGPVTTDPAAVRRARRRYRSYGPLLHPDRVVSTGLAHNRAQAAFAALNGYYHAWVLASESGTSAAASPQPAPSQVALTGRQGTYVLGGPLGRGSIATVYAAESASGPVAVKMPRNPASSRLVDNERTAYAALAKVSAEHNWLEPYFPVLLDTLTHRADGSGQRRQVNVLNALGREQGFVTLAEVEAAFPQGLDGRDWAWMFRRLLRCLAGTHLAGLVHGAVLPDNVFIHPGQHGVVLAGWSFATTSGSPLPARIGSADTYPAEAATNGTVTDRLDVFMAARLGLRLLRPGERRQRAFMSGCTQTSPGMRPTAAGLLAEYDDLLRDLYGPRRFREFHLPATVAGRP